MTALHDSCDLASAERDTPRASRDASGLQELCRRSVAGARLAGHAVARAAAAVRWYMTQLMGDSAYETYLAHQRRTHPDAEVLTERQFWRQKMDDQDRNPGARCC